MKKKMSFLLALCLMCALFAPLQAAQAANSKVVHLKENKTYRYDLNGDKKKESVKVVCKVSGYSDAEIQLYINGKKFYSRKRNALDAKFYLAARNRGDGDKVLVGPAAGLGKDEGGFVGVAPPRR